jgi:hypothetical protein
MEESKTVILENKEEYSIVDALNYNGCEYYLLSNVNNLKDICIRKVVIEDVSYICRLQVEELRTVYAMFLSNNKEILEGNNL